MVGRGLPNGLRLLLFLSISTIGGLSLAVGAEREVGAGDRAARCNLLSTISYKLHSCDSSDVPHCECRQGGTSSRSW